jgi:hypothetical protein
MIGSIMFINYFIICIIIRNTIAHLALEQVEHPLILAVF